MDKYYIQKDKEALKNWLLKKTDNDKFYLYFINELLDDIFNFINANNLKSNQGDAEIMMHFTKFLYAYSN